MKYRYFRYDPNFTALLPGHFCIECDSQVASREHAPKCRLRVQIAQEGLPAEDWQVVVFGMRTVKQVMLNGDFCGLTPEFIEENFPELVDLNRVTGKWNLAKVLEVELAA